MVKRTDVLVVVAVVALVAILTFDIWYPMFVAPPAPVVPKAWIGSLALTVYTQSATTPRVGLVLTPSWYRYKAGGWFQIGSGNMTLSMQTEDNGVVYMVLESSANYMDDNLVKQANTGFLVAGEEVQYTDVDNDGYLEHVFKLKFTESNLGATIGQATTPTAALYAYGWVYDTAIDFNNPTNITGVGTAPVDKYINWKLVWGAQNRAVKVYELYIVTNATSEDEIKVSEISSVLGTFAGTAIEWQETNKRWYVKQSALGIISVDEPHALFVKYPREQNPDFAYFNVKLHCDFVSSNTPYSLTIYMKILKPDGSTATITSLVTVKS